MSTEERSDELLRNSLAETRTRTSHVFRVVLALQAAGTVLLSLLVSPYTWIGATQQLHIHVMASAVLGLLLAVLPLYFLTRHPSAKLTRYAVALAQMLFSTLLIHVTGGRIETHFHVFGSLALLAFYRDLRLLLFASGITAADHFLRGMLWTESVFGVLQVSNFRWLEHAAWVLFQVTFLSIFIRQNLAGMQISARTEAALEAREAEQAVLNARTKLEFASLEQALDEHAIVSMADRRGRITYVNPMFCQISGYSAEELIGQDHRILNSGWHKKEFWVTLWKTIAAGQSWRGEVCNRRKDGTLYWVDSTIAPILGEDGKPDRYVSIRFDITSQRRAELRLQMAMKASGIGLWDWDLETGTAYFSETFYAMLGYEQGELPPKMESWKNLVHPEDLPDALDALARHVDGRVPNYMSAHRVRTKSGQWVWIRDTGEVVEWTEDGDPKRVLGVLIDIDEVKRMQIRLERERENLHVALETSGAGFWDLDVRRRTFTATSQFFGVMGVAPIAAATPVSFLIKRMHPDDVTSFTDALDAVMTGTGETFQASYRLKHIDESYRHVRASGKVVRRGPAGDPVVIIGTQIDIDEIARARAQAEHASQTKSAFLANMSHEIRTPMTAILGYADLLGPEGQLEPNGSEAADALRSIRSNAGHLLTIINDILDVSKIEAGQMSVELIETSPSRIAAEAIDLVRPRCKDKGLGVSVEFATDVPERIMSDPTRLRQILLNLLGNAIKFTEDGSVTIRVSCNADAESLTFAVVDTGIGMTQEALAKIRKFEAFSQADTSVTRRFGGTGLGLRISSALAEKLGGGLSVDSQHGVGSTFGATIATGPLDEIPFLPAGSGVESIANAEQLAPASASTSGNESLKGVRVLVAEDGPDNQRLIAFHLKKAGAEFQICENGLRAVQTIEAMTTDELPDVILMDMQMPELDGYGATGRLREQGCTIPVIALTAHAMDGDRERCIEAGCNDYTTKPIDKQKLIGLILHWANIDRRSGEAA
ncbi:MAG: PAS domain-containing protein [Planctomycetota bacterium]